MRKFCLGMAVVAVLLATGCSDESDPLSPGDPESPAFQALSLGFGDIHEATLAMTGTTFEIVGGILEGGSPPAKPGFEAIEYTVQYNLATEFWVVHLVLDDEAGNVFTATDSVQLLVNGLPQQYPDPEELDLVRSFLTMEYNGVDGTFSGHQNVTAAPVPTEAGVLVTLNGSGHLSGALAGEVTNEQGVSACEMEMSVGHSVSNLVVNADTGGPECPISGRVTHNGSLSVGCTGAEEWSHSGSWNVTVTFGGENSFEVRAVSGGNVWSFTDVCS